MEIIDNIYRLRQNFIIIGLTGRTGSGCSTVGEILKRPDPEHLPSVHPKEDGPIDNEARKNKIIHDFIVRNWKPFKVISASDVIFYYAFLVDFNTFVECFIKAGSSQKSKQKDEQVSDTIRTALEGLKDEFMKLHEIIKGLDDTIEEGDLRNVSVEQLEDVLFKKIKEFREMFSLKLREVDKRVISRELQTWGDNIRLYNSIKQPEKEELAEDAPACLASKINKFIKVFRLKNKESQSPTLIAIDALRNPFEILFFRERYSGFYSFSVNTTQQIRHDNLFKSGYTHDEVKTLDEKEKGKKSIEESYKGIDVDRCIQLSDIHLVHDGTEARRNKDLVKQIFKYLALIKHPGLVPPSPEERLMQVAYTAMLNSGCLSRQVGAAVTDANFSLKSIGWNSSAQGQTPCTLRSLFNLYDQKDEASFSKYERTDKSFNKGIERLAQEYHKENRIVKLNGINLSYCFKDVYTDLNYEKQKGNQVHTRSLHAEENAFLQIAKYGGQGLKGGKLFTTASCCELCGKKAYQLGIREIYYIDSYPGITADHILECGDSQPRTILFQGAIGKAYISLYSPLLSQKDEIETLTGVNVKYYRNLKADSEISKEKSKSTGKEE